MKCPKCQFETPEGAKFCNECGHKLEITCSECGQINPPKSKFCVECGHQLTSAPTQLTRDLSFDEKLSKIQRYLPKGITEKILAQKYRIEGERKHVTVMFCDMEGFTQLAEKLGPEETYATMDQIYEILIHKVHNYEGTVNEMTGDGIMALFGAPIALEDAPQRAIRSAYAIHREMTKFNDKMIQEKKNIPSLKMRIGIHTGPVVVGTLGNDLRVEFKAVGDTVNLASRMEGLAEPGSTYVTEDTYRRTEGLFRFEALGEYGVKGITDKVKAYRVIAPSTRRTRFDVSADRGLTPFFGRERELEILLDEFKRARDGCGQVVSIIAEAGVGKSRLLYEFRKAVANEDVTFLEGRCLSYSKGVAYHLHMDILRSNFNILDGEGDFEIRKKVKRGLRVLEVDESSTLPYLLELLGIKDSGIDKISMSHEARRDRIIEALRRIVIKGSEIRPLILAYEDLHWMDDSSEDILKNNLESIPGLRVLVILTYRPEYAPVWGGKSYHNQVNLNRLSNRESLLMVSHLFGFEVLERNLEELILEKTEGIPFFIEEFVRSLKDLKLVERRENRYCLKEDIQSLSIPSTIQDVIMARVDALPEGAKNVLQTGSVIERKFNYALIKRVTGLSDQEMLSNLSVLKDAELIYERGIYPETTYVFKHALTREVVYDSIITKRKRKLHYETGSAIEKLYKENLGEHYSVLVEHFIASESYEKAAKYSKMACKKAEKAAALNNAIAYAEKGINCLERLPETNEVQKKIIDARTVLGLYLAQMNYFIEAKEAINAASKLASKSGYKRRLAQIYTIVGSYHCYVEEDFPNAIKYLQDALAISEEVNDIVSLVLASFWLGSSQAFSCDFKNAYHNLKRALDINELANNLWGASIMKSHLAREYYFYQGQIDLAYQTSVEAIRLAEESGDIYSKTITYSSHGMICTGKGYIEEAKEYLFKGLDYGERIKYFSWNAISHYHLGEIFFQSRKYQKAIDHYNRTILLLENSRLFPSIKNYSKICLAKSKLLTNEKDINFEQLLKYAADNKIKCFEGIMYRFIAEILLNMDDQHLSDAWNWIEKAIEVDEQNGTIFQLGLDCALRAEFLKRKGDQTKARESLFKAIEILKECGADGWVEKYEKELAEL